MYSGESGAAIASVAHSLVFRFPARINGRRGAAGTANLVSPQRVIGARNRTNSPHRQRRADDPCSVNGIFLVFCLVILAVSPPTSQRRWAHVKQDAVTDASPDCGLLRVCRLRLPRRLGAIKSVLPRYLEPIARREQRVEHCADSISYLLR